MVLGSKDKILLEMMLFRFKDKKFTFTSQNILKTDRFFHLMVELQVDGYLTICNKNHQSTFYELTDKGDLYSDTISNDSLVPDRYKRLRRGCWINWVKPW